MIELLEGLPGQGKSYFAVAHRIIPQLKAGRRVVTNIEGVHPQKFSDFLDVPLEKMLKLLVVLDVKFDPALTEVENGKNLSDAVQQAAREKDYIVLDEIQIFFPSGVRPYQDWLRFLSTHRHQGIDIVFITQNWKQVPSTITRLVENTDEFQKYKVMFFWDRFSRTHRSKPDSNIKTNFKMDSINPAICGLYKSYSSNDVKESSSLVESVLTNPKVLLAAGLGCVALYMTVNTASSAVFSPYKLLGGEETKKVKVVKKQEAIVAVEVVGIWGFGNTLENWSLKLKSGYVVNAANAKAAYPNMRFKLEGGRLMVSGKGVKVSL